jgi:hypothetical protein
LRGGEAKLKGSVVDAPRRIREKTAVQVRGQDKLGFRLLQDPAAPLSRKSLAGELA